MCFESRLLFKTYSGTAIGTNCSDSDTTGFDFCHVNEVIVFKPNATEYTVPVRLLDDAVAELEERFTIKFSEPENIVLNNGDSGSKTEIITIDDQSDCELIQAHDTVGREIFDVRKILLVGLAGENFTH